MKSNVNELRNKVKKAEDEVRGLKKLMGEKENESESLDAKMRL